MKEFDLIQQIKQHCTSQTSGTQLGIGDDAAIINPDPNVQLVVSTDTLVAGVHFKSTDPAHSIGHKALAVNFSDMAAMAAVPKWVLLNLTLPTIKPDWIEDFIQGFAQLLSQHQAQLIGGDTTQGPLAIGVTVLGETTHAITRSQAKEGDLIVVSGVLGSAAFALNNPNKDKTCTQQLQQPLPRLDISDQVKEYATAMIDVSDGLLADLKHICAASQLSAVIELTQVPINPVIKQDDNWMQYVLAGGDDYQLCFTIKPADEEHLPKDCHVIGQMLQPNGENEDQVMVLNQHQPITTEYSGYEHFKKKT